MQPIVDTIVEGMNPLQKPMQTAIAGCEDLTEEQLEAMKEVLDVAADLHKIICQKLDG